MEKPSRVVASSGAISVGFRKLGLPEKPHDIPAKQASAAVGQCELMYTYDKLFSEYGHAVAQVLLTRDVVENAEMNENAVNTFDTLLGLGAIPIVNENDTVSIDEIKIGDNDTLSAMVATMVRADLLVLMSDIDGLYDSDPHTNPGARLIERVERITDEIMALGGGSASAVGTGGMLTKLTAAKTVTAQGIDMVIVSAENPDILYDVLDGKPAGTRFAAQ